MKKFALGLYVMFFISGSAAFAEGEVHLENLANPIKVTLQTPLSSTTSVTGDKFEATLPETVCLGQHCLEQGAKFFGSVVESQESIRFRNEGYIALKVESVAYPSGETLTLSYDVSPKSGKVYDDNKMYYKQMRKRNRKTYVPIKVLILVNPIAGMAARVGTAAALGLKDERLKNESLSKRLIAGYYNSSVTSEFVSAARKKEADYKVGELIYLNIPEKTLATVFNISPQEYESIKQR